MWLCTLKPVSPECAHQIVVSCSVWRAPKSTHCFQVMLWRFAFISYPWDYFVSGKAYSEPTQKTASHFTRSNRSRTFWRCSTERWSSTFLTRCPEKFPASDGTTIFEETRKWCRAVKGAIYGQITFFYFLFSFFWLLFLRKFCSELHEKNCYRLPKHAEYFCLRPLAKDQGITWVVLVFLES